MSDATLADMESAFPTIRESPRVTGTVELIVCRLGLGTREVLEHATLDVGAGLIGDAWAQESGDDEGDFNSQLTLMNARAIAAVAGPRERWPLAGDQLFVDFDLSRAHVPPGTLLDIGEAVVRVTAAPHTGCAKFAARFGRAARAFVNSPAGRELQLRGIKARVVRSGRVRRGDTIRKHAPAAA